MRQLRFRGPKADSRELMVFSPGMRSLDLPVMNKLHMNRIQQNCSSLGTHSSHFGERCVSHQQKAPQRQLDSDAELGPASVHRPPGNFIKHINLTGGPHPVRILGSKKVRTQFILSLWVNLELTGSSLLLPSIVESSQHFVLTNPFFKVNYTHRFPDFLLLMLPCSLRTQWSFLLQVHFFSIPF